MSDEKKVINIEDHMGMHEEVTGDEQSEMGGTASLEGAGQDAVCEEASESEGTATESPDHGDSDSDSDGDDSDVSLLGNPEDVNEEITSEKLASMMQAMQDAVKTMQEIWLSEAADLGLKPEHMKALYDLNNQRRCAPPDDLPEEEKNQWDYWNGLNTIEWEDLEPIFGESHKCYGVDISQTRDRLKHACQNHHEYLVVMTEYRQVHDGYLHLVEQEEEAQIQELQQIVDNSDADENLRQNAQASIDRYYHLKYLRWIGEPLDDASIARILKCLSDEEKASYYIRRTRDKLQQLDISDKFIPEISKFENRFLPEEYKWNSQVLLSFFCHFCTFANISDTESRKSMDRTKIVCFVHGMDMLIRKQCTEKMQDAIMESILQLENQFLDKTPRPAE